MKIQWDQIGDKKYELGVDHGVLFLQENDGSYPKGVPWNGLTNVTESPEGAEPNDIYADNIKYGSLRSTETWKGTIESYTYPDEFAECNGEAEVAKGVYIGQQSRRSFGFSYRTNKGDDSAATVDGYKIHCVYGCTASPSEQTHETINDSPEPGTLSWEINTVPVSVVGNKPTATITIDSEKVDPAKLAKFEDIIYGSDGADARLPLPAEIIAIFGNEVIPDSSISG